MSELVLRGWVGPAQERLHVQVAAGACAEVAVPDAPGLLRRVAGLAHPLLWIRLDQRELGRLDAAARARAGLATVDGRLPLSRSLTVLDLILAGRALPGRLGFLGAGTQARRDLADAREAEARALAGRLGLGPLLDQPAAALDPRAAAIVDVARALLAEPRAVVAAVPEDPEAAAWLRARLASEAGERLLAVLLLRDPGGG